MSDDRLLGEHMRTIRKPRRLSCGGNAKRGWHVRQQAVLLDGDFICFEVCERCVAEEHGYEPPPGPRHGNFEVIR